jgi:hypothetical protein
LSRGNWAIASVTGTALLKKAENKAAPGVRALRSCEIHCC